MRHAVLTRILVAGGLVLVGALAGGPTAAGGCISAVIDEPFRLPDGSEHQAGRLTLCLERTYSPVAAIHRSYVDGMPVGLFVSRNGTGEGLLREQPFMTFLRPTAGPLQLANYGDPARDHVRVYTLNGAARPGASRVAVASPDAVDRPTTVLIAATPTEAGPGR